MRTWYKPTNSQSSYGGERKITDVEAAQIIIQTHQQKLKIDYEKKDISTFNNYSVI